MMVSEQRVITGVTGDCDTVAGDTTHCSIRGINSNEGRREAVKINT